MPPASTFVSDDRIAVGEAGKWNSPFRRADRTNPAAISGPFRRYPFLAPSPDNRYLLSSAGDQTLRIWKFDRNEPLLSLFFAGDQWIAWTPEGYYAASPGGERLMGWQVNNGLDQMATFYPAAQFRKSLYRPDVIKLLLQAGSLEKALEMADQERGRAGQATRVNEVLPPHVVITTPDQPRVELHAAQLTIRAIATPVGKDPVTALRLLCDGRPYQAERGVKGLQVENTTAAPVRESWDVELTPGSHRFTVKAETAKSYGMSEPVEVVYATDKQQLPALYVVAIGISAYKNERLRLKYGADDARKLAETFQKASASLYSKVETKVLADDQATR